MKSLNWELKQLGQSHRDGSYATQQDRERVLTLVADQLIEIGFETLTLAGMKPIHIETLAKRWIAETLSTGTLKNRMAHLRWMAEKIGKRNIVARSNDFYGIADRVFVTNDSKARELTAEQLSMVTDPYCAMSLRLQAAFGLRREESLKLQPDYADRGDVLRLKASWCKGGRLREIPIRTEEQRQLIDAAKSLAQGRSLIPVDCSYKEHLRYFRSQCERAGIHKVHGHRHWYAQERYRELTGWACRARGGPTAKQMTAEQKRIDREARMTISRELGHGRGQITSVYLGR
jgi:hypothetical protein